MKVAANKTNEFVANPPGHIVAVLVYGPDEGRIRETATSLAKRIVADLNDPFRVVALTGAALRNDPARLLDEARALAFTGGRKVIRVRDAGTAGADSFINLLNALGVDALVVAEGGDLAKGSPLRRLFEDAANAAALACYGDEGRDLESVVRTGMAELGLKVTPDAFAHLVANLGSDRGVTRSELAKLAVYMGNAGTVGIEDARACIGDSAATSIDRMLAAIGEGDQGNLEVAMTRCLQDGMTEVGLLRLVGRHFDRLHLATGLVEAGERPDQAMARLRPPIFYKAADSFRRQLRLWSTAKIARAIEVLLQAETDCKTTGLPAEVICRRALMRLTQAAVSVQR